MQGSPRGNRGAEDRQREGGREESRGRTAGYKTMGREAWRATGYKHGNNVHRTIPDGKTTNMFSEACTT
eukprot:scaffold36761_cov31-Tisochrysis_lutea.AAC.1